MFRINNKYVSPWRRRSRRLSDVAVDVRAGEGRPERASRAEGHIICRRWAAFIVGEETRPKQSAPGLSGLEDK